MPDLGGRPASADDRFFGLAFYVVVDVSYSMEQSGAIAAVNNILPQVHQVITGNSMLADVVRLCMIDFSDDARVQLRMSDLRDVKQMPEFKTRGGTSYAAAFRLLRQEIPTDIQQLKDDRMKPHRPAVFFITDGEPTDDPGTLRAAFDELTDQSFKARPNIIPFGVGQATKAVLDPWVFPKSGNKALQSFAAREGADPAKSINKVAEILISSVVASAQSISEAGSGGGFIPPDIEDIDDDDWDI